MVSIYFTSIRYSCLSRRLLADTTRSGKLYFPEFALAMYLCKMKLVGKPLPISLPNDIKKEISNMRQWIISREPTAASPSASGTKPPDFNILQALESKSTPQRAYPGPVTASPVQQKDFQCDYGSPFSQNSTVQPQHYPQDPSVNPPLHLSQPYASTIPQDNARSYQGQYNPGDFRGHPPPYYLSQSYASTISQENAKSSQPQNRGIFSKILGVSGIHSRDMYVYTN
jgi:hypothetical protein